MVRVVGATPIKEEHPLFNSKPSIVHSKDVGRQPWEPYSDKERLLQQAVRLRERGLSYMKIAKELGISPTTIRKWIKPLEIETN